MAEPILMVERLGKAYPLGGRRLGSSTFLDDVRDTVANLFRPRPVNQSAIPSPLFWALRDVSLSVAAGELVGVIGNRAAGKSTLFKVLNRITEPTSGRVRLRGRVAAMLDLNSDFIPELTARENIFLRGAILGMTRREIRNRFDELVDFSGLGKFLDTPIKRYSLGMTTALSFAIAAHLDSDILLVDEVFSYAGPEYREKCMAKMRHDAGMRAHAVLFVSQDMAAVRQLCPRVILMDRGRIVADGPADEVTHAHQTSLDLWTNKLTTGPV
jgi:lipopolysaccharide transport system ATP-binding protein